MEGSAGAIDSPPLSSASGYRVWARICWMALDVAREARLDLTGLFEGLPFDAVTIHEREHIDWNDFAILCDRLTERAGGLDALRLLLDVDLIIPELCHLAGALVSPLTFSRIVQDLAMPAAISACRFHFTILGRDRFQLRIALRPGARPCLTWFCGYLFGLRSTPRHLGLPPATVIGDVSATHGNYDVRLPESRSSADHLAKLGNRLLLRLVVGRAVDGTLTSARFGNTGADGDTQLAEAATRWALTGRQVDVLARVAKGESNKEIAAALQCAENTTEFHVTQLFRKAGVSSRGQLIAAFWAGSPSMTEAPEPPGLSLIVGNLSRRRQY